MLTIVGGIAEFERDLIRSRCDEGIDRARKLGKRFGRPERLDDGQKRKIADSMRPERRYRSLLPSMSVAWARSGGRFNPAIHTAA
jgi:DNA invertase Pin-like site-specific DNA recombinase